MRVCDIGSLEEAHPRQVDHLGWPVLTGRYVGSFSSNLCSDVFFHAVYLTDGGKTPNASWYKYNRAELAIFTMLCCICQRTHPFFHRAHCLQSGFVNMAAALG